MPSSSRSLVLTLLLAAPLIGARCGRSPHEDVPDAGADAGSLDDDDAGPPRAPDETPPVVTFLLPAEDCLEGEVDFAFEVKDAGAGVGFVSATFAARSLALVDEGQGRYRASFDVTGLSTGPHALAVNAVDLENNVTEAERVYGTARDGEHFEEEGLACGTPPPPPPEDTEPPAVQIVTPPPSIAAFAADELPVGVTVTDDVGPVTVVATLGGVSVTLTGVNSSFSGTLDVSAVPEGAHELVITATDAADHAGSATRSVTVDRTPPTVVIVEPTAGATRAALTDVVCQASDDSGVTRVVLYEVGDPEPLGISIEPAPGTDDRYGIIYQLPCAGLPRETSFEMRASDPAGNIGSASVSVSVNTDGCEP